MAHPHRHVPSQASPHGTPSGASHAGHVRPISTETRGLRQAAELPQAAPRRGLAARRQRHAAFEAMVEELKAHYKIAIRKWRTHMSGVAYELKYPDGTIKRLITAPRPRSPVSACIFLHEVGHHAVGFHRYKLRCMEEFYVWQWTFRQMTARNIPITPRVLRHYRRSMYHYVRLARKRGLRELPPELQPFTTWPG